LDIEAKAYWSTVEEFLRDSQDLNLRSVVIVGLTDHTDTDAHDVISAFGAGPFELMEASNVLQLHANLLFTKANEEEETDDDAEEER
jgi:hypothetical protein